MLLVLWLQFWAMTLSEGTYNNPVTWEDATKWCNLSVIGAADVEHHNGHGFWQPFVQINTNPIITKGCHMLETPTFEASRSIENNNVTTCYHFCKFDNPQLSKIKAFMIKGNNCYCVKNYDEDERECPNSCAQNNTTGIDEQGNNINIYTVYEIGNTTEFNAGCGSTRPSGDLTFDDCNTERGAYWDYLANADGKQLRENLNLTWDAFNGKCNGHLASSKEAKGIRRTSDSTIPPSTRFWVGERIWSYLHFGFDFDHLSNKSEISITCGYYNKTAGKNEFGPCSSKHFYNCSNVDMIPEKTESSISGSSDENKHDVTSPGVWIGIIVGIIAILVILLASIYIYIKRRKARNRKSKPFICTDQVNEVQDRKPIYDETCLENDYDHLHESPDKFHDASNVNVYDVSRPSEGDNTIRGGDVYDTANEFSKLNETYDSTTHTTLINPNKGALNDDPYNSIQVPNEGINSGDANLPLTRADSTPRNDKTSDGVYHEIS